jgi:NADH-ubiquinone oxidoreductase chain 5
MGGMIQLLPMSYTMILIGSLALVGFPFLTGFYSKDVILEIALTTPTLAGNFTH